MRRFLFIIPPYFKADDYKDKTESFLPAFTTPYGVLSLITFLDSRIGNDITFEILDLNITLKECIKYNHNYEEYCASKVTSLLRSDKYHIIGISALFNSAFPYIEELSSLIKITSPDSYVITGGGLPSAASTLILQHCPSVDAVCKGEGEVPLLRVLTSSNLSAACDKDESFLTRHSLSLGKVPKASYLNNLDEIPVLQYQRVDLNEYNSRSIDKRFVNETNKREMAIHTSRGCPFKCVFCSNPSIHGYDVRFMSLQKVELEIIRMKEEFGMTVLLVEDDHFFHNKERAKSVLRIFAKHGIRAEFPNGMAVYAIDDEVAELLSRAGVSAAALAVESGSDFVLTKLMKKPVKTKFIRPAVESLRRNGVRAHAFVVAGIPGETNAHREETRQMLLTSNFDWVHIYCAVPIFGSRLFDICMESNYIDLNDDPANFVVTKSIIKTPDIDPVMLQSWVYRTQIEVNFTSNANMRLGCYDRALPYFDNVAEKYPTHAFGRLLRGIIYKKMGDYRKSESDLQSARFLFENPEWFDLASEIGNNAMDLLHSENIIPDTGFRH
jgi:anaerobic magnesium-protoporphyrin IX monomethyl ester cyclase